MAHQMPSIDAWLAEAKNDPSFRSCGMYLIHNGTVRETPKAEVRSIETDGVQPGGKVGSIVVAAGAGQVLFVGDGVKGYGNLVIIKHSPTIVTAYGHNSKIVVKVGQSVKAGQKIAELGQSDASEPMLRFEVRDKGKPVDPMRFMAPRR